MSIKLRIRIKYLQMEQKTSQFKLFYQRLTCLAYANKQDFGKIKWIQMLVFEKPDVDLEKIN